MSWVLLLVFCCAAPDPCPTASSNAEGQELCLTGSPWLYSRLAHKAAACPAAVQLQAKPYPLDSTLLLCACAGCAQGQPRSLARAGIGRSIERIEQIEELQRPLTMEEGGIVLMDLLWSDPTTNDGIEGVQPSPRGPGLVTFGPDRVKSFCQANNLQARLLLAA